MISPGRCGNESDEPAADFGVPSEYFFEKVHPEIGRALRRALDVWKDQGAVLMDVQVRHAKMASAASAIILGSEAAAFHQQRLKQQAGGLDALVRERLEASSFYSAADYIKALRVRAVLIEEVRRLFESCDVLMLPAGNAAPLLEEEMVESDVPREPPLPARPDVFNLANMTGIPALVLPCGFTAGPPVLPIGIQLCAKHFDEAMLFRVGHAYQSATDWHKRRPPL
jgi:aspartyl-tRNA(Asn)/glutamyl-tRNA(Gln) amidotransferase subunit A